MGMEKDIINKTVTAVKTTTELFYQQKNAEGYASMEQCIASIMEMVNVLHAYKETNPEFPFDEERIVASLTEAMQAMEAQDLVLLADILEYDFVEYLTELAESL